jgi:hypothetical protein
MHTRTAITGPKLSDAEFLDRLRQTPIGRDVIIARDQTLAQRRAAAAENVATAYAAEAEALRRLDTDLTRAQREIDGLAEKLRAAQQKHGDLTQQRAEVQTTRLQVVNKNLAFLQGTAPAELLALAELARIATHSAKFHMRQRPKSPTPIGLDSSDIDRERQKAQAEHQAKFARAQALLRRAQEVGSQVSVLLASPTVDLETVARLRVYLDAEGLVSKSSQTWTESR